MDFQNLFSRLAAHSGAARFAALLTLFALLLPVAHADDAAPIRLQHDPQEILAAVARRMNVTLRPEQPLPRIYFESGTTLQQFQDAIAPQWHFRPPLFANAYVVARNEIYLMDDPTYYRRMRRTLDESLAHEFAHYLQVMYFAADLSDETCEHEAIAVQVAFRMALEQAPGEGAS